MTGSPEPSLASDLKSKQKPQLVKEKDSDTQSVSGSTPSGDTNKRKRKGAPCRKDEQPDLNGLYKVGSFSAKDGQDGRIQRAQVAPAVVLRSCLL